MAGPEATTTYPEFPEVAVPVRRKIFVDAAALGVVRMRSEPAKLDRLPTASPVWSIVAIKLPPGRS